MVLSRLVHRIHLGDAGQSLILFAAGAAFLCGAVGLAVDAGQIVGTRTDLQKAADAAAFAGAQSMPNLGSATTYANQYVNSNAGVSAGRTITFVQTVSPQDTVQVVVTKQVNFTFGRAVGLTSTTVSAQAKARAGTYSGGSGILPFGFIASNNNNSTLLQNGCYQGNDANADGLVDNNGGAGTPVFKQYPQLCQIKFGAGGSSGGDFGALSLGSSGAAPYEANIANGSTGVYSACNAQGQPNIPGSTCKVPTETGNMSGPTNQGFALRLSAPAPSGCNTYDPTQVLTAGADGKLSVKADCLTHPRIGIIPVVDKIQNPEMSTILGFAFVWIDSATGSGNNQSIKVYFLTLASALPKGYYTGSGAGSSAIILVE